MLYVVVMVHRISIRSSDERQKACSWFVCGAKQLLRPMIVYVYDGL